MDILANNSHFVGNHDEKLIFGGYLFPGGALGVA